MATLWKLAIVATILVALCPFGHESPQTASVTEVATLRCLENAMTVYYKYFLFDKNNLKTTAETFLKTVKAESPPTEDVTQCDPTITYSKTGNKVPVVSTFFADGIVPEFDYLCITFWERNHIHRHKFYSSNLLGNIYAYKFECPGIEKEEMIKCAIRLLSQPRLEQKGVYGISAFIKFIKPTEPVCEGDLVSEEMVPSVYTVSGHLKELKLVLSRCIDKVKAEHLVGSEELKTEQAVDAAMEAGVKAHFGCNVITRGINAAKNRRTVDTEYVEKKWITDCVRDNLKENKKTGLDLEQFAKVFGSDKEPATVAEFNNFIQGIRCSSESVLEKPDVAEQLRILGGPLGGRMKAMYENLHDYVKCFIRTFRENEVSFGEVIGCKQGPKGLYEKTRQCTKEEKGKKKGPYNIDLPSSETDIGTIMNKKSTSKWLWQKICTHMGDIQWKAAAAKAATVAGNGIRDTGIAILDLCFTVASMAIVLAIIFGSTAFGVYLSIVTGAAMFAVLGFVISIVIMLVFGIG